MARFWVAMAILNLVGQYELNAQSSLMARFCLRMTTLERVCRLVVIVAVAIAFILTVSLMTAIPEVLVMASARRHLRMVEIFNSAPRTPITVLRAGITAH